MDATSAVNRTDAVTATETPPSLPPSEDPFQHRKQPRWRRCRLETKIAFAKTHKTGSSTVQNILLRFGVRHGLVFALPSNSWMFDLREPLNASEVLEGPWKQLGGFDIFAFHSKWNYSEVLKMVPGAKFITILREPLRVFESNLVYFNRARNRTLFRTLALRMAGEGRPRGRTDYVGQNNLLWDLGTPPKDIGDDDAVDAKIREANETFDLVMIAERFEESLVLLANLLCWPLEDVMYLRQNARLPHLRNMLTDETEKVVRPWLRGDYKLYNHFKAQLERRIDHYGRDQMALDTGKLARMNAELERQCVVEMVGGATVEQGGPPLDVYLLEASPAQPWCLPYTRRESDFCLMIRRHQAHRVEALRLKGEAPADRR